MNSSYASTFTQHLDSPPSNSVKLVSLFISLQRYYRNDIATVATVATFSFLRVGRIDGS